MDAAARWPDTMEQEANKTRTNQPLKKTKQEIDMMKNIRAQVKHYDSFDNIPLTQNT